MSIKRIKCRIKVCNSFDAHFFIFQIKNKVGVNMKIQNGKAFDELPWIINAEILMELFGVSKTWVSKTMKNPGFPSFKIGRRRFVENDKLINWIRENQDESGEISIIKL